MQVSLHNLGLFQMKMSREIEPQQYAEKNKFFNRLDEAIGFMCAHISRDILFQLEGLRTSKESWDNLEYLFGKNMSFKGTYWRMIPFLNIATTSNIFNNSSQNTSH